MDEALEHVGGYGCHQKFLTVLIGCLLGFGGMPAMVFLFAGRHAEFVCGNASDVDACAVAARHSRQPPAEGSAATCGCCPSGPYVYTPNNTHDTYAAEFDLVCANAQYSAYIGSAFFVGFLFGAPGLGFFGDKIGRKPVFIVSTFFLGVFTLWFAAATTYSELMITRVLSGFCSGGVVVGYCLLMECCDTESRSFAGGCAWGIWTLWVACVPLAAYIVDVSYAEAGQEAVLWMSSWRLLCVAVAVPNFTVVFATPFLVESPRFLLGSGQTDKAWAVLTTMARWNGLAMPSGGPESLNSDKPHTDETSGNDKPEPPVASLLTLFRTDRMFGVPMWCVTCSVAYLWLAVNVVYYGVSIFASLLPGSIYVNVAISTLIVLVPYFTTGMLTERFGRRLLMILTLGQAGVGCLLFSSLTYFGANPLLVSIIAFASKLGITLSFSVLYVFSVELFPTDVRSKGMGFVNIGARFGGILAPPIADLPTIAAGFFFCVFAVLGACVSCLLPETKGRAVAASLDAAVAAAAAEQVAEDAITHPPLRAAPPPEEYYGHVRPAKGAYRAADRGMIRPASIPSNRRPGKQQDKQQLLSEDDTLGQELSSI